MMLNLKCAAKVLAHHALYTSPTLNLQRTATMNFRLISFLVSWQFEAILRGQE